MTRCVSLRGVCSEARAVQALMTGCSFTVVSHRTRLDISGSLPIQFHVVIHEPPQAHRKYQIEGRPLHVWTFSLPISHRTDDAHDMLLLCPLIRRVSHWTKPPYSSRNFVQFLCQPVPALDDQVRTLQQDLRTQPSLQRRRFSCVALCAHRGFLGSTRGGSVGWCCAAMPARNRMPVAL